MKKQRLS
jgi:flagellar biosynthesis chaperone FliJ